jgi:hypothetical protein
LAKDASENEDWVAVGHAVSERIGRLRISLAYLARETGLSETTIRYIDKPTSRHNKSTLVALSAVLGWRYDHLTNILRGESHKNDSITSPIESHFENLLHTEVGPVKDEVAVLKDIVQTIDTKIDVIIENQRPDTDTGEQP